MRSHVPAGMRALWSLRSRLRTLLLAELLAAELRTMRPQPLLLTGEGGVTRPGYTVTTIFPS
ncbi:hypothetical protein [Pleomorphomonas diazotrophica]|uniref:hypothetical protein n=1 Tax=Pleomorphomonas diazotrophica TaxID=1166257 RepID=UPI00118148FD|nr:hypothetical protein [Pleomorphomonas diazotrophica]